MDGRSNGDELFARARFYEAREGGVSELSGEARRHARCAGGKKSSAQEMPNAQSAFHNSRFLPSFSLRYPYPPPLPAPLLFSFPLPVLSFRAAPARARPSIDKGEGPFVAKKFGYFATFHVDKLRLAQ